MKHRVSVIDALVGACDAFERQNFGRPESITISQDDGMLLLSEIEGHLVGGHSNRRVEAVVHVREPMRAADWRGDTAAAEIVEVKTMTLPHRGLLVQVDGVEHMQVEFMGIKVRWPAKRMALPGGRYLWY